MTEGKKFGPEIFIPGAEIGKTFAEFPSLKLPEIATGLSPALESAIEGRRRVLEPLFVQPDWLRRVGEIGRAISAAHETFTLAFRPLTPILAKLAEQNAAFQLIEDAGWLPHDTNPVEALAGVTEPDLANQILERHYRDHWGQVRAVFELRLGGYDIDEEAKATFVEVLDCHQAGHYRAAIRTLFPEIERIARNELHGGSLEGIASQPKLREAAGGLPVSAVEPGGLYGLNLFSKLYDGLYALAKTDEKVAECAADPVPNRHAAVHGLVSYRTRQSSINAIIMADYILQVICVVKHDAAATQAEEVGV